MSQFTMIQCPTCGGNGAVPQSTDEAARARAIQNALRAMESAELELHKTDVWRNAIDILRDALAELRRVGVVK